MYDMYALLCSPSKYQYILDSINISLQCLSIKPPSNSFQYLFEVNRRGPSLTTDEASKLGFLSYRTTQITEIQKVVHIAR